MTKYNEYKKLDFPAFEAEILAFWEQQGIFEKSVTNRDGAPSFVFYEGPPSANGMPGIHHVMARTVKDIFCRYQTLNGKQVKRKAGWDTHGLPVELQVEKMLGITKDDIGKKISVAEYNEACRKDVMKYTDVWNDLTRKMGYWVDLSDPYITYENNYIESLWWVLKQLYDKGFLYKGYTIQPYSPAAGTGLSSHELNQPGTYKDVKDMTAVAMFKAINPTIIGTTGEVYFLAWTTTPWTLPSNTALAVGEKIEYAVVQTFNQYSHLPCTVILAKNLLGKYFAAENAELDLDAYKAGDKKIPYRVITEIKGKDLAGTRYDQLLPFAKVENGDAFKVIIGDFVTTEDGTGIVHIAPSFGADDFRVAKQNGIGSLTLVDKRGKFLPEVQDGQFLYGEEYVKEAYLTDAEKAAELANQKEKLNGIIHDTSKLNYLSVDERIVLKLQTENKLFKKEKYDHTYPHCWRTDKPILYYPLESWFIKTTAVKDKLIENNKTINWKPEHTGSGRFGNWLENLVDWNLSRSRYWGTPLPIWRTEDGSEQKCIGSQAELKAEIDKAIASGVMDANAAYKNAAGEIELHKPYVDNIVLLSGTGAPMLREPDLIDVWFDSGAMPYAQWGFPFNNAARPLTPEGQPNTQISSASLTLEEQADTVSEEEQSVKIARWKTANMDKYSILIDFAKANRRNQTEAESLLWNELSNKKLSGYKFRRQHIVGDVIPDFVCLLKKLVVEVDGGYHLSEKQKEFDGLRSEYLANLGYKVIRFTNEQVLLKTQDVLRQIQAELDKIPHPNEAGGFPPLRGLGGQSAQAQLAQNYPADFIAEGVDQTRGWFFTLHALAVLLSECSDEIKAINKQINNPGIAFKNVIANGLVLDKNGNKMSKRLGNVVDPFEAMAKYGADANRWYMLSNSDPWDNLKFDIEGVAESQRKFFGTLYNTYSFFAIYANIDAFEFDANNITPIAQRTELDRWIMSKLNSLVKLVSEKMDDYDATPAVRAIEEFTTDHFSNWFIRLSRRRFWKGEMNADKKAAYETLYQCLMTVSQLSSPFAPFFSDWIYQNLRGKMESVHLTDLPVATEKEIDAVLEEQMEYAQKISSLVLSIRKKENIKVRQPLQKMLIPMVDPRIKDEIKHVQDLILSEVNVKELEFIAEIEKSVKPNFRVLGKKVGAKMKVVGDAITALNPTQIHELEQKGLLNLDIEGETIEILSTDVEILTADIAGYKVANDGKVTVALDLEMSDSLRQEGIARELVSKLQNLRKELNFEVTDRIQVQIQKHNYIENSIIGFKTYICTEILASGLDVLESINDGATIEVDEHQIQVKLFKN